MCRVRGLDGRVRAEDRRPTPPPSRRRRCRPCRCRRRGPRRRPAVTRSPDNWLATLCRSAALGGGRRGARAQRRPARRAPRVSSSALLYAKLAGAKLYPSVDVMARGGGKMSGDNSGLTGAALTVSWELDLWGRVRYGPRGGARGCGAAQADFAFARQSLAAQVAQELVPRDRSRPAGRARAERHSRCRSPGAAGARTARASAWATKKKSSSRAPTSGPTATPCARSSWRRSRRSAPSKSCSGDIRRRAAVGHAAAARAARRRARGTSVAAARAAAGRHRRRATRRRSVQSRRRGESGTVAGDRPHDRRERDLERPLRPEEPRQSGVEPRREPAGADLQGRRAQDPGRDPHARNRSRRSRPTPQSACGRSAK